MPPDTLHTLVQEGKLLITRAAEIQDLAAPGDFPHEQRTALANDVSEAYHSWYAKVLVLVPSVQQKEVGAIYEGTWWGASIQKFLAQPLAVNPLWTGPEESRRLLQSPFLYPFATHMKGPMQKQLVVLEQLLHRRPQVFRLPDREVELPRSLVGFSAAMDKFLADSPYENNVFLMMKYREHNSHISEIVNAAVASTGRKAILAKDAHITDELGSNVLATLLCCRYGIALFDEPEESQEINPNVAYELGMMHLLDRECLVLKSASVRTLQSDILSKLYVEYNPLQPGTIIGKVKDWLSRR